MKEVGASYAGVRKRVSVCPDIGFLLCGSCAGIPDVWVRDVRYFTAHWQDLGWITPQGGPYTDGESTAENTGCYVCVPPPVIGEGVGVPT